jgi:MoxR-like ATPase
MPSFDLDTVPAHDRERVAALIPDPRIAAAYVHRHIDGVLDFTLFDYATSVRENVSLAGPTGSSKTTVARAYAAARGLPFVVVECNGAMDPGTILGRTRIGPDGAVEFLDGDMTLVARYGGVILIDEVNLAHPRITAAWHGLLSVARRLSIPEAGEVVRAGFGGTGAPQPVLLITAFNPRYQGTVRINEAFANRFAMPLDWGYVREVEEVLIPSHRLLDTADGIRALAEIRTAVSTNSLQEFVRHNDALGWDLAVRLFLNRFDVSERAAVGRALEANSLAIQAELAPVESQLSDA